MTLVCVLQFGPVNPLWHVQSASWNRSTHWPPALQQSKLTQSSVVSMCSQWLPNEFVGQVHLKVHSSPTNWLLHVPPLHGLTAQLSCPCRRWQSAPPNPGWHWHSNPEELSWQIPPFLHGFAP